MNQNALNIFKKATRFQVPLKMAITGPSGSGKTYTSLMLAQYLAGDNVFLVDTEGKSALLYADEFAFHHTSMPYPGAPKTGHHPENYIAIIKTLEEAVGDQEAVLIIDSLSHEWEGEGGMLEMVDFITGKGRSKFSNGWRVMSPIHQKLVETILRSPLHIIATMRSKTDYQVDSGGKVAKLGLAPIQRPGMDYEFSVLVDMDRNHRISIEKTRCKPLTDRYFDKEDTLELAQILKDWLNTGEAVVAQEEAEEAAGLTAPGDNGEGTFIDLLNGALATGKFRNRKEVEKALEEAGVSFDDDGYAACAEVLHV